MEAVYKKTIEEYDINESFTISEGKIAFSRSGVGQALNHQVEALGANNVDFTLEPEDKYDLVHINTIGLKSWEVLKKSEKGRKTDIYSHSYNI